MEENGWPIPDLLLVKGDVALLFEIDQRLSAAEGSFLRYRSTEGDLKEAWGAVAGRPIGSIALGFCRSVLTPNPAKYFETEANAPVDCLVAFDAPGAPVFSRPLD